MSESQEDVDLSREAERRAYHNVLERMRRDRIKQNYVVLQNVVPSVMDVKASRLQILTAAVDYIRFLQRKDTVQRRDIEYLRRVNGLMKERIRQLEESIAESGTGHLERCAIDADVVSGFVVPVFGSGSGFDGVAYSDNSPKNSPSNR
ncbi:protein max-like [Haemaphysalis longicornis]|uniref:BHLH domain-containing protein n=1 Tax=Haemaphysalis longicornis TaxID=44386 RepID=A0A9J6FDF8_HAELO|nr:hypothetical protein HPB48_009375 [Haemaphysalis longicornis]